MRILLEETRKDIGKYMEIDLSQPCLPNLYGLRIKELTFTKEDRYWLTTHTLGTDWLMNILTTKFGIHHG